MGAQDLEGLDAHTKQLTLRQGNETDGARSAVDKCYLAEHGRRVYLLEGVLRAGQDDPYEALGKQVQCLVALSGSDDGVPNAVAARLGTLDERSPVAVWSVGEEAQHTSALAQRGSIVVEEAIRNRSSHNRAPVGVESRAALAPPHRNQIAVNIRTA